MRYFLITVTVLFLSVIAFMGKRSDTFSRPPWQVFPDMDDMEKYLPQRENAYHEDGRSDRPIPVNTVHRGNETHVKETFAEDYNDDRFSDDPHTIALTQGLNADGKPYSGFPIEVNEANLELGRAKYDLYCAICHGVAGDGNGPTKGFGLPNAANLHNPARQSGLGKPEGSIFNTLTVGYAAGATGMVSFADRLTPTERWAVTLYIRALQKMRVASSDMASLPAEVSNQIKNLQTSTPAKPEAK